MACANVKDPVAVDSDGSTSAVHELSSSVMAFSGWRSGSKMSKLRGREGPRSWGSESAKEANSAVCLRRPCDE